MNNFNNIFESTFPFWQILSDSDKEKMCRYSNPSHFEKGANIHGGDGECTGAILVMSGCIRAYMLSEEGKEITLYRLYPNDICMLSASCVLQSITFDVMVDAQENSECIILNGKMFSDISEKYIEAKAYALEIAVKRFSDVMWIMQQILFMSLDKRLAIFLYDEISKSDSNIVSMSNEQIAKYIGSAREAVSRMLKYFSTENIAKRTPNGIVILDKDKLRQLAL